jgi:predicted enzyme involved in methoxymalonyl-ACP biosynthesis
LPGQQAELDTFLMSCRVIGRQAESAFMECLLRLLAARGVTHVIADYLPTPKNDLVRDFLPRQAFATGADHRFHRNLNESPPRPAEAFPIDVSVVLPEPSLQSS